MATGTARKDSPRPQEVLGGLRILARLIARAHAIKTASLDRDGQAAAPYTACEEDIYVDAQQ